MDLNQSTKTPSTFGSHSQKTREPSPDIDADIRPSRSRKRSSNPPKVKLKLKGGNGLVADARDSNMSISNRGLRRSPRRHRQIIDGEDQGQKSKSHCEPVATTYTPPTPTFTKYRIPKKSNPEPVKAKAVATGLKNPSQSHKPIGMKTPQTPVNSSPASVAGSMKRGDKGSFESVKKELKETNAMDKPLALINKPDDGSPQNNRQNILKAKRRLGQPAVNSPKLGSVGKVTSAAPPLANKTFEDLPDYEDSIVNDEDDEELTNPMHNILKMVKCGSNPTDAQPQDPVLPEVTAMDVDVDLPLVLPTERVIIVPDTNIWINDLRLIETLVNKEFSKPILIIIPWMVLQELDVGLHQKARNGPTSYMKMKKPIQYINMLLSSKHPKIQGQKAYEAAISKLTFDELVADDSILNCVFQNVQSNNSVIFVTNDTNLLNKALVNGITATNGTSALTALNEVLTRSKTDGCSSAISPVLTSESLSALPPTIFDWPGKRRFDSSDSGCDNGNSYILDSNDIEMQEDSEISSPLYKVRAVVGQQFSSSKPENEFQSVETALLKAFSYIIRRKMIEDYGMGGWEYALKIKPPWTLFNAIKCMSLHWIANFSFVFTNRAQKHLDNLKELIQQYKSPSVNNRKDVESQIIDSSISLFNFIDKEFTNEETVAECKRVLLARSQVENRHSFG